MSKSDVFFTDFRTEFHGASLLCKIQKLMKKAGFESIDFTDKFTAIKMHFGEAGNLAYLRPNYARAIAEYVKELGGKPFLTDCSTLYVGGRKNALDHLDTAAMNGFNQITAGCQILIGDGLKGTDEVDVPVPNGTYFTTAKIGRTIMDADVFLSLTHFKGHEKMGIGGVVKNIGMGCGSRAGKMEMHSDGKPVVIANRCVGCGICAKNCAHDALTPEGKKMTIDHNKCTGCGRCISACPKDALAATWGQHDKILDEKTAEYAAAVLNGRPHFHVCLLCDITPNCDCHGENDAAILPDIGILAGFDPVAIDVAACDLCKKAPRLKNTWLDDCPEGEDVFDDAHGNTRWRDTIEYAVKIGLGSDQYNLITM